MMLKASVLCLVVFVGVVLGQMFAPQISLYPVSQQGFDVVELNDMSFVNEIHYQTFNFTPGVGFVPNETSFFIFGGQTTRSIYPGQPQGSFTVGAGLRSLVAPYIDVHSFLNGTTSYFIGPTNPTPVIGTPAYINGYDNQISVLSTGNDFAHMFANQPVGFEGTWSSVRALDYGGYVVVYVAGFFLNPNGANPTALQFGVNRFHVNLSAIANTNSGPVFSFNASVDQVSVRQNAMFYSYNTDNKPFMFHFWNLTGTPSGSPNTTWTFLLDPAMATIYSIKGDYDPTIPLTFYQSYMFFSQQDSFNYGANQTIVSAMANPFTNTITIGIAAEGTSNGWLLFMQMFPLAVVQRMPLPANYSDPRALVFDYFNSSLLYVGGNGGPSVLQIFIPSNLATMPSVIGSQNMPFYLHRVWRGVATYHHVYFVTNEQHSKVFRISKDDFCSSSCMPPWGYCQRGSCVCPTGMTATGNMCQWNQIIVDNNTITKEKGGEIALGLLFAFTFIAAAAGWFMWWRNRRHSYQSV